MLRRMFKGGVILSNNHNPLQTETIKNNYEISRY